MPKNERKKNFIFQKYFFMCCCFCGSVLYSPTFRLIEYQVGWCPKTKFSSQNWLTKVCRLEGRTPASHPAAPGLILGVPENFSLDAAEHYWWHCLEQWSEAWYCQTNPSSTGSLFSLAGKMWLTPFTSCCKLVSAKFLKLVNSYVFRKRVNQLSLDRWLTYIF